MDHSPNTEAFRNRVINLVILVCAGLVILIQGVIFLRDSGRDLNVGFYIQVGAVFLSILVALFRNRLSIVFKVGFFVLLVLAVMVSGLNAIGFMASSKIYIVLLPAVVSFFLSLRRSIISLVFYMLAYGIFAWMYTTGRMEVRFDVGSYVRDIRSWIVDGSILFMISLSLVLLANHYQKEIFKRFTELRNKEKVLSDSEERNAKLVMAFPDLIIVSDLEGNIVYCNDNVEKVIGLRKEDYRNPDRKARIHPEDQEMVAKIRQDLINGEDMQSGYIENRFIDAAGREHWFSGTLTKLYLNGELHIQAVSREITARKQMEMELQEYRDRLEKLVDEKTAELRASEEKYRFIADNATDIIWVYNLDHRNFTYTSPSARWLGYKPGGSEKLTGQDILDEKSWESVNNKIEALVEDFKKDPGSVSGKTIVEETRQRHVDGTLIWVELVASLHMNLKGELELLGISRNIDKRKRAELELARSQEKLIQSEKMASLGILTAGVAHEINNPLNYIMGAYQGLEQYFSGHPDEGPKGIKLMLEGLDSGISRISSIVKGLNQFSRNNKDLDEVCDLHSIIDNCLTMLSNMLKHRVKVRKVYAEEKLFVMGNVGQLHQVFTNLLTNASQAIPEEGDITIKSQRKDDGIVIQIIDSGTGIVREILPKVTDPFFTTKDPGQGTGLGLSITYSILKEHGGSMKIKSSPGMGTSVTVTLPNLIPDPDLKAGDVT